MQASENPYATPEAPEQIVGKISLVGGIFRFGDAQPFFTKRAWISLSENYLRADILPRKVFFSSLIFSFALMGVIPLIYLSSFPIWAIHVVVCFQLLILFFYHKKWMSKIEFSLLEERMIVDLDKNMLGIRKIKQGKPVFIGAKAPKEVLDQLLQHYDCEQGSMKQENLFWYTLPIIPIGLFFFYVLWKN